MAERLAFILLRRVLDVVKESGANRTEAECALNAAAAMISDLDLEVKPTLELYLDRSASGTARHLKASPDA